MTDPNQVFNRSRFNRSLKKKEVGTIGCVPQHTHQSLLFRQLGNGWERLGTIGEHNTRTGGVEGAAHGAAAQAGLLSDLSCDSLGPADWCGIVGQIGRQLTSHLQQLRIPTDMLVALLFRQIEAVECAGDAATLQAPDPAALTRPVCEVETGCDFLRLPFACHPISHCQQRGEIAEQFERLAVARAFEDLLVIVNRPDRGGGRVKPD